jgi:thymidylate synthase, flavin-dependent
MKIIEPSAKIITPIVGIEVLKHIEKCGRVAYKSEEKTTEDSYDQFINKIIKSGHESVIEHISVTANIICDRGVSHELVRHRIASYTQESSRYCNYSQNKFGNEISVIKPSFYENKELREVWENACGIAELLYFQMLDSGGKPQEARSVLPNSLKTEIMMTTNLREWRHFFKLRCAKAAHPDMRIVANILLEEFKTKIPVIFDDITGE